MTKSKQRKYDAALRDRYTRNVARVHVLKKELRLDRDVYEDILFGLIGRRTVKDASPSELRLVIKQLEAAKKSLNRPAPPRAAARETGRTKGRYTAQGKKGDGTSWPTQGQLDYVGKGIKSDGGKHLTQKQADEIARLEQVLGWTDNPKRLGGFITRQTKKTKTVEMLGRKEASKVILGLRKLLTEKRGKTNPALVQT